MTRTQMNWPFQKTGHHEC